MRLSEWRATAPAKDAVTAKVAAVVDPVLESLGTGPDPHGWVVWGEEPRNRYSIFIPTDPGLIFCFVRVNVSGEGPRATTKLIRWNRVSIGELAVETQGGHRMLTFQLESQVLRGADAEADRVAAFALRVIAAIDGRPLPPVEERGRARRSTGKSAAAGRAAKGTAGAAQPAASRSAAAGSAAKAAGATARPKTTGPRPSAAATTARGKAPSDASR